MPALDPERVRVLCDEIERVWEVTRGSLSGDAIRSVVAGVLIADLAHRDGLISDGAYRMALRMAATDLRVLGADPEGTA